jgi:hypothetical protein
VACMGERKHTQNSPLCPLERKTIYMYSLYSFIAALGMSMLHQGSGTSVSSYTEQRTLQQEPQHTMCNLHIRCA